MIASKNKTSDDDEVAKVQKFSEQNGHHFPERDFVEEFKKIRKAMPKTTAKQFLGASNVD